jgi:phosphoribosylanthranilate isomerase
MRESENILDVSACLPDYLGFIYYAKSPRAVPPDFRLPEGVPASIKKVAVCVNDSFEKCIEIVHNSGFDYIQLHGDETVQQCARLKDKGIGVIKAFAVHDEFDFERVNKYQSVVDYFLFDTKGEKYGGNGLPFNWRKLEEYNQQVPYFLSGGISPENIVQVKMLAGLNIHAVDVNSGVETTPAVKNVEAIKKIMSVINS